MGSKKSIDYEDAVHRYGIQIEKSYPEGARGEAFLNHQKVFSIIGAPLPAKTISPVASASVPITCQTDEQEHRCNTLHLQSHF